MSHIKISIIMPVYNSGAYLQESINGIRKQTFREFELICVDDASNDVLTKEILDKQSRIDGRIKIISLEKNVGAGEARNIGFRHAVGEYVIFLDADDIFKSIMLERMYKTITEAKADICITGYKSFLIENGEMKIIGGNTLREIRQITGDIFEFSKLPEEGLRYWELAPWNKLCRKKFLEDRKIFFQSLECCNDVFFSIKSCICAEKIICVAEETVLLYYRRFSGNQISARRKAECLLTAIGFLLENMEDRLGYEEKKKILYIMEMGTKSGFEVCSDINEKREFYYSVKEFIKKYFQEVELKKHLFLHHISNNEFDEYWVEWNSNFYYQFCCSRENIFEHLRNYKEIIIWGDGERGQAFQKICIEEKKKVAGVADARNDKTGQKNSCGNKVISCKEALQSDKMIVATNHEIYQYLLAKEKEKVFDLQKYCQF